MAVVVQVQAAVIVELRAANAAQARVVEALQARVAGLERQLGRHSRNSSKPPSSDGLAKPPTPRRERGGGGRKPGKQPGAPGAHLAQVPDPDEVVVHRPVACQGCGSDLTLAPVTGVEARQVLDLPEVRLWVTEHQAERRRCGCGQVTLARFPAQARSAACYGPGVRALAVYLGAWQHLPVERTAELLAEVLGAPVSTGLLAGLAGEGAAWLELSGFTKAVCGQLAGAEVVHFDATGARVGGRLRWIHSASTALLSWFTVHPKRGVEAMDAAGVLPGFAGVAVHDGWAPYRRSDTAAHALCVAHLLRELEEAAAPPARVGGRDGRVAVDGLRAGRGGPRRRSRAAACRRRGGAAGPLPGDPRQGPRRQPAPTWPRRPAASAQAAARGVPAPTTGHHRDEVCRFLVDLRVPPTNNQAERDLRMVKLQQKISGCWRTLAGAEAFLVVRSYLATTRKHGVNPLAALRQLFEGHPWLPASAPP